MAGHSSHTDTNPSEDKGPSILLGLRLKCPEASVCVTAQWLTISFLKTGSRPAWLSG